MKQHVISIRPFIGAKNFDLSRSFYQDLGFQETVLFPNMSLFTLQSVAFYLQDGYVKDWVDNTMLFLEVEDVEQCWNEMSASDLPGKYPGVRLIPIRHETWGKEFFLHDPSGILWHIGTFFNKEGTKGFL